MTRKERQAIVKANGYAPKGEAVAPPKLRSNAGQLSRDAKLYRAFVPWQQVRRQA